jgi:DHA1 family multidrug resistance protein-like MFS transporter
MYEQPVNGHASVPQSAASGGLLRPEFVLAVPVFATRMVYLGTLTLLPPLLVERGISPAYLGVLVGVYGYASVFMGLLAGALADRFPPARLAAAGSALVSVAVGLLWAATAPVALGAARLLHGIAMGLFRPAASTLVLQRVPAERRASAISINNVAYVAGAAAGPVVAGVLADGYGLSTGLAAGAGVALVAAGYLLMQGRRDYARRSGLSVWSGLRDLPSLVARRRLSRPLAYILADMTILHLWLVFLPLYLVQVHGFALTAAGSLLSLEALAYAVAQPWWGRVLDRGRPGVGIVVSLVAHGLLVTLLPLAGGNWPVLAMLLVACGALNAGAYPGAVTLTAGRVDDDERGRAMGLLASTSDVGQILGPLVGSVAYAVSGRLDAALLVAVGIGAAGAVLGWLVDRVDMAAPA